MPMSHFRTVNLTDSISQPFLLFSEQKSETYIVSLQQFHYILKQQSIFISNFQDSTSILK